MSDSQCWRVSHCRDHVESVYLVTAASSNEARREVQWQHDLGHRCDKDCSWSMSIFHPSPPYFLYAINMTTGQMTPADSSGGKSMCVVCLGNVPES